MKGKQIKMEEITKENYATNHGFFSYSRVSRYMNCEASAAAQFYPTPSTAQLVGSYVDAYFSNELTEFKETHPDIFNVRTGALKADFCMAEDIIKRIQSDETFCDYMTGEKQVIMTGTIDEVPFKIKMDVYNGERIVDLKVMKDFDPVWTKFGKESFITAFHYDIEMAIFQEIVRQNTGKLLPCYLACVTKEKPSDIGIYQITQDKLDEALENVKNYLPRIKKILNGEIKPNRCEKCEYCRKTKKARVLTYDLCGMDGDQLRDNGVESCDPALEREE